MSSYTWPDYNAWLQTAWGAGAEFWSSGFTQLFQCATNLVFGNNPPYALDDFLAFYPKFFGQPTLLSGCTVSNGSAVVSVPSTDGLLIGQFLLNGALPSGSVITAVGNGQITLNQAATADAVNTTLQIYENPLLPVAVIQLYLNLAYASLVQARWQEQWTIAMGWFIAHYCTLWLQSDAVHVIISTQPSVHYETPNGAVPGTVYTLSAAPPTGVLQGLYKNGLLLIPNGVDYTLVGATITLTVPTVINDLLTAVWPVQQQLQTTVPVTAEQAASQGVANGILVSKSVGDVSASYQALTALENWGAWNLTRYGQQLATMAKVVGSGPMVIW